MYVLFISYYVLFIIDFYNTSDTDNCYYFQRRNWVIRFLNPPRHYPKSPPPMSRRVRTIPCPPVPQPMTRPLNLMPWPPLLPPMSPPVRTMTCPPLH